jgi:hypothetical protein
MTICERRVVKKTLIKVIFLINAIAHLVVVLLSIASDVPDKVIWGIQLGRLRRNRACGYGVPGWVRRGSTAVGFILLVLSRIERSPGNRAG